MQSPTVPQVSGTTDPIQNDLVGSRSVALAVDLDGTLVRTDLLHEAAVTLLARAPWMIVALGYWLLFGKSRLKEEVFSRTQIAPETLPYDPRVVDLLKSTSQRPRVLCTASCLGPAQLIAHHLGLFEDVLATDANRNLAGEAKASALAERFGERGFDYVANAKVDIHVWRRARRGWVVNAGSRITKAAREACDVVAHWPRSNRVARSWFSALRVHQWLKNLLVLVPLLAAHRIFDGTDLYHSAIVLLAFGLCASGVYVVNDLIDIDSDRRHPRKRRRPLAAGDLPIAYGVATAPLLMVAGLAMAASISAATLVTLAAYLALTFAYSLRLKRIELVDVITLAGLYTLRIIAGAVAISTPLSFWLLAFSMFVFLSLAMLKRFTELHAMKEAGRNSAAGRGYKVDDLSIVQALGTSAGFIAVLVLCLYINSQASEALYRRPEALWLICPLLLYWMSRGWLLASRGEMHDDPIVFAAGDRASQIVVLLCGLTLAAAI